MTASETITFLMALGFLVAVTFWIGQDAGMDRAIRRRGKIVGSSDPCWCGRINHIGSQARVFDSREHTRTTCLPVSHRIRRGGIEETGSS